MKEYLKKICNRFMRLGFVLLCIILTLGVGTIVTAISLPLWPITFLLFGWEAPFVCYFIEWEFDWMEKTNHNMKKL